MQDLDGHGPAEPLGNVFRVQEHFYRPNMTSMGLSLAAFLPLHQAEAAMVAAESTHATMNATCAWPL